jgi:hypothetical protein
MNFFKLIRFFDVTAFEQMKSLVPANTKLKTGVTIEPHVLQRIRFETRVGNISRHERRHAVAIQMSSSAELNGSTLWYNGYMSGAVTSSIAVNTQHLSSDVSVYDISNLLGSVRIFYGTAKPPKYFGKPYTNAVITYTTDAKTLVRRDPILTVEGNEPSALLISRILGNTNGNLSVAWAGGVTPYEITLQTSGSLGINTVDTFTTIKNEFLTNVYTPSQFGYGDDVLLVRIADNNNTSVSGSVAFSWP